MRFNFIRSTTDHVGNVLSNIRGIRVHKAERRIRFRPAILAPSQENRTIFPRADTSLSERKSGRYRPIRTTLNDAGLIPQRLPPPPPRTRPSYLAFDIAPAPSASNPCLKRVKKARLVPLWAFSYPPEAWSQSSGSAWSRPLRVSVLLSLSRSFVSLSRDFGLLCSSPVAVLSEPRDRNKNSTSRSTFVKAKEKKKDPWTAAYSRILAGHGQTTTIKREYADIRPDNR